MYALSSPQPVTKTLVPARGDRPAVTVTFNPQPSPLSLRAASRAVIDIYRAAGVTNPKRAPLDVVERAGDAFSRELVRHNILSWTGLGSDDETPVEPTPDHETYDEAGTVTGTEPGTISAFLAEPRLMEGADREYVLPWSRRDREKNALSPSLAGIGAGAMPDTDTASLPAGQQSTDDVATTTGDPAAPTTPTPAPRTRAKRSGS